MPFNQLKKITTFLKIIENNDIIGFNDMLLIDKINIDNNLNLLLAISSENINNLFRIKGFKILNRIFEIEKLNLSRLITERTVVEAIKSNNIELLNKIFTIKNLNFKAIINIQTIVYAIKSNNINVLNLVLDSDRLHVSSFVCNTVINNAINVNNIKILDRMLKIKTLNLSLLMQSIVLPSTLNNKINNHFELVIKNTLNKNISVTILNRIMGIIDCNNFINTNYKQLCNFIITDSLSIFENSLGINKKNYNNIIKIINAYSHIDYSLYKKVEQLLTRFKSKSILCDNINMYIASYCI